MKHTSKCCTIITENNYFVEKFQIPRGKLDKNDKTIRQCVIREFQEETGHYFKFINFIKNIFILRWIDNNIEWEYEIHFAFASFKSNNIIRVKNLKQSKIRNKYEPLIPQILNIITYFNIIKTILPLYGKNNYLEFINFIKKLISIEIL